MHPSLLGSLQKTDLMNKLEQAEGASRGRDGVGFCGSQAAGETSNETQLGRVRESRCRWDGQ